MLARLVLTSTGVGLTVGLTATVIGAVMSYYGFRKQYTIQRLGWERNRELEDQKWARDQLRDILSGVARHADAALALVKAADGSVGAVPPGQADLRDVYQQFEDTRRDLDLFATEEFRRGAFSLAELVRIAQETALVADADARRRWELWMHNERAALAEGARRHFSGIPVPFDRLRLFNAAKEASGHSALQLPMFAGPNGLEPPPRQ